MFVYDFTPVAQAFESARTVLASDAESLVAEAIEGAYREALGRGDVRVLVGPPREREETVAVTLTWSEPLHQVATLEGDLELAPLGSGISHLSLSANYQPERANLGRRVDEMRARRATEALVRTFLVHVAYALEHTELDGRA